MLKAKTELEKLKAIRKELESESHSLIEKQQKLEKEVLALEEQTVTQELEKEKALVEDLRSRNEATKNAIAQLEAKKKEFETKLGQITQTPEGASESQKASETPAQTKKAKKTSKQTEAVPEGNEVTVTVVESEEIVETQEKQQKKKKHRFF
jgi:hypothetical protein